MTRPARPSAAVVGNQPLLVALLERVLDEHVLLADADVADVVVVTGTDLLAALTRRSPKAVLAARSAPDGAELLRAVRSGALAVVVDDEPVEALIRAVHTAADGHTVLTDVQVDLLCGVLRSGDPESISPISISGRELDLLRSIERGESVKQTARALGIAIKTVENTQRLLFRKIDVRNRAQAMARAHELGLLAEPDAKAKN